MESDRVKTTNGECLATEKVCHCVTLARVNGRAFPSVAISSLRTHPTRIRSMEEAVKLNGVGQKTAEKVPDSSCNILCIADHR